MTLRNCEAWSTELVEEETDLTNELWKVFFESDEDDGELFVAFCDYFNGLWSFMNMIAESGLRFRLNKQTQYECQNG